MTDKQIVISLLGSGGGVAKAILSILDRAYEDSSDPVHPLIRSCSLHLVDWKQKAVSYYGQVIPHLQAATRLHEFDLQDLARFRQHLTETNTTHVIDVSWADTVDMLECCSELGVAYVNTALENIAVDENDKLEGFTLLERYRIFKENRGRFTGFKAIIGSGMNPGVVQWMAVELLKQTPDEQPLGCYIVEHDTSFYADRSLVQEETIYSTWSPECFLDEAIYNYPMFVKNHIPHMLYRDVYELAFKVSLGNKTFYGCLMPHEEVLSLGEKFAFETGFIYRVSDYMTGLIQTNLDRADEMWDWDTQVLTPADGALDGEDQVGVLLVYPDRERYMYNVMSSENIFPAYKTNATYFQVACGLYGALASLLLDDIPDGIYWVDELLLQTDSGYGRYLTYYMKDFVTGENNVSDGLLLDRLSRESTAESDTDG